MLRPWLERILDGGLLSVDEARAAFDAVMAGAPAAQVAGFLTALRLRGETDDEIEGAARSLRAHAQPLHHELPVVLDTCGTGGDGAGTFNISTTVAFVCAGAGVAVAKHGNRAVSSRSGSADVLEALGVPLIGDAVLARAALSEDRFAFLFAPAWHPAMRSVGAVRRELGVRTVMNLLGPLVNPARATHQLVGVYSLERVEPTARVLGRLGSRRAIVVHGDGALDELSLAGPTRVAVVSGPAVEVFDTHPEAIGLGSSPLSALAGGDAQDNARLLVALLEGQVGPRRDAVLLNAAWALFAAEAAESPVAGLELARRALDSGAALAVLEAARRRRTP